MAVTMTDIETAIDNISTKLLDKIIALQSQTQMEDEFFATVVAGTINSSVDGAIRIVDVLKRNELADKDLLIKDQQELAEKIKNGGIHFDYTYDANGNILTKTLAAGTTKSIYEVQKELVEKQILDVTSTTTVRNEQSEQDLKNKVAQFNLIGKDLLIKDQLELAEKIKNGSVSISHTYDVDGNILTTTYGVGTSKSIYEAQTDLMVEQKSVETKKGLDIISSTNVRNQLKDKDLLIKDQQELAEKLKNGGINYIYTYDLNGAVLSKTLSSGTKKSIYEAQADKTLADVSFTNEQEKQLGYSVTYNNRLKTLQNYSDTLGNLGIGGFVIPAGMWTTYFGMMGNCYTNGGAAPTDRTYTDSIVYPTAKAV